MKLELNPEPTKEIKRLLCLERFRLYEHNHCIQSFEVVELRLTDLENRSVYKSFSPQLVSGDVLAFIGGKHQSIFDVAINEMGVTILHCVYERIKDLSKEDYEKDLDLFILKRKRAISWMNQSLFIKLKDCFT